jgi:hypothetical protein
LRRDFPALLPYFSPESASQSAKLKERWLGFGESGGGPSGQLPALNLGVSKNQSVREYAIRDVTISAQGELSTS